MINKLYTMISENKIITDKMFRNKDLDELLDLRDIGEFDNEWVRVDEDLTSQLNESCDKELINDIRKKSFMKAYDISNSGEIAECISDDFELIAEAIVLHYNDSWLNKLMECYFNGIFPCGILEESSISLDEIVKRYL